MKNQQIDEFKAYCKANGKKFTLQRFAVYKYISVNHNHPMVDQVWEGIKDECPSITRESIYRILNEFVDGGLLKRMDTIEVARYDTSTANHGHFFCQECEEISDFELENSIVEVLKVTHAEADHVDLRISGTCDKCKKK